MPLAAGARLGPYEIVSALGAGGMGEVYRARDTKLKREVAIKVLPGALSHDPDRLARFQKEAEFLAALNHPHIAAIYGFEESGGISAIVLELIEGETLADCIARGAIPLEDALRMARQMADAIEAAHEKGVVHRDLKPANVKITPEGQIKVLDFGLAKMLEREPSASLAMSPTFSVQATNAGVILGTAAYMSPEQARGKPVDKRADIWAFGVVLLEMLTGRPLFKGETVTDILASVVTREADFDTLPAATPPQVRDLLRRSLAKDPKLRLRDIGEARIAIDEALRTPTPAAATALATPPPPRRRMLWASVGLVVGVAVTAIAAWTMARFTSEPAPEPMRFSFVPPSPQSLAIQGNDRDIAISPDGMHLVYRAAAGSGQTQLMVRALNELEARPLSGTLNPRMPFVSPDSRWVGYFAGDELKKTLMIGGAPITVCRISGVPRGASWGPDDTIVFATNDSTTGLLAVPAGGGEPKTLTTRDVARSEADHLYPSVLPDGRAVLFTTFGSQASGVGALVTTVLALDRQTGEQKMLISGASHAEYVDPGYLVYAAVGSLRAVRFDPVRLEVLGDPVPVVDQVMTSPLGAANFSVSRHGSLVFVPGTAGSQVGDPRSLVWVDRQGREEPIKAPPRTYAVPRIAPDGTRAAVDIRDRGNDIWIWDFKRQTLAPLTFAPGVDYSPVWTPDGRRIVWSSIIGGTPNLFWQEANGTGAAERLTSGSTPQFPTSVSVDGTRLLLFENVGGAQDIASFALQRAPTAPGTNRGQTEPIVHTPAAELNPELSPDGRWLAYQSNRSGQFEIYVSPFPNVDGGLWPVSQGGGTRPVWARSGRELFYLDAKNFLTVVPVQTIGAAFAAGNQVKILATAYYPGFTTLGLDLRGYDVSPDGQRFLMIKESDTSGQTSTSPSASLVVVLNWSEELKAKLK